MSEAVLIETDREVLTITWNDPDRLNGLTGEMINSVSQAIELAPATTRVIVIAGAGRAFTTGARLGGTFEGTEPMDIANRLIRAIVASPVPVIAAVNGPAAGFGASIAFAADITVAAQSAYFLLPFVNIGLMPDGGASVVIAASIGRARASALALLGERLSAEDAMSSGLIHKAVADADFEAEVRQIVTQLSTGAAQAYRATKRAIAAATLGDLDAALDLERDLQVQLFGTEDFVEGATAFMHKRPPVFTGR